MPVSSTRGRTLRTAVTVVLCALFFLLAMGVVLLSSGVYRDAVAASDRNFTRRTALSYVINQVRRGDVEGGVSLGSFGGGDALFLHEGGFTTILYCYDGQLRELYAEEGIALAPGDGTAILPLAELEVEAADGCLRVTATDEDGARYAAALSPRCGWSGEAAP